MTDYSSWLRNELAKPAPAPVYILQYRALYDGRVQAFNDERVFRSLDDAAEAFGSTDDAFRVIELLPDGRWNDATYNTLVILAWRSYGCHEEPHYEIADLMQAHGIPYYREKPEAWTIEADRAIEQRQEV